MDQLQLSTSTVDGIDLITARGELDTAAAPRLRSTVLNLLEDGADTVIVDLSGVSLLDCAAVSALMQAQGLAHQRGKRLYAAGAAGRVLEVLEVTGVVKQLRAYESPMDAVERCTDPDTAGDPRLGRTPATVPHHPSRRGERMPEEVVDALLLEVRQLAADDPHRAELRRRATELALPLAEGLARRYHNRGQSVDDLVQVASVGLVKAIDGFNPDFGHRFVSYAIPTILGELRRYFRDKTWGVRVPRRLQELRLDISRATDALSQVLDRSPTIGELAEYLEADEEEIIEAETASRGYRPMSLSQPLGDNEDGVELIDLLGSDDADLALVEFHVSLPPMMAKLPVREQKIIALRFFGNQTQSEIARQLGISQMHVSRLLTKALATLRGALTAEET